jgi:hypothetical protein
MSDNSYLLIEGPYSGALASNRTTDMGASEEVSRFEAAHLPDLHFGSFS